MRILLIGLGRMGLRHVKAIQELGLDITAVEPNPEGLLLEGIQSIVTSLDEISGDSGFDAAIVAATADVRAEQFLWLLDRGVPKILLEKPLCQSRRQLQTMCTAATEAEAEAEVSVHLYRRMLPAYHQIRNRHQESGAGPLSISVMSGASGLGCNGVHWIDFALWLTGAQRGELLFGELNETLVASGRGPQFSDLGGTGVFGFSDGSRLHLSILADSSAPATFSIYGDHHAVLVDQECDVGVFYDRDPESEKPKFLYGQDYSRHEQKSVEAIDLSAVSRKWLESVMTGGPSPLPPLSEARIAHDLLFDLLETSGETEFAFT